jgi:predicted TIM-barrel fold metal-dependent hydrolase
MKHVFVIAATLLSSCVSTPQGVSPSPLIDYHQHLVSPEFAPLAKLPERDGASLIRELDLAGIRQAVVLSVAYSFADERKALSNPDQRTRFENDWTAQQVRDGKGRLIGFCSANPLREAALAELERCLQLPGMIGIKQHLGNAGVSLRKPDHLARMQQVFALAQRMRVPILAHLRARGGENFGAEDARLVLTQLVPIAPDVEIVIAHFGASSPGYPSQNDEVMAVFGEAAERNDPRMRNIFFDPAANITAETTPEEAASAAKRIRQVGVNRILYGSDLSPPGGSVRSGWEIFRTKLPLTAAEIRQITRNRPRFAR